MKASRSESAELDLLRQFTRNVSARCLSLEFSKYV